MSFGMSSVFSPSFSQPLLPFKTNTCLTFALPKSSSMSKRYCLGGCHELSSVNVTSPGVKIVPFPLVVTALYFDSLSSPPIAFMALSMRAFISAWSSARFGAARAKLIANDAPKMVVRMTGLCFGATGWAWATGLIVWPRSRPRGNRPGKGGPCERSRESYQNGYDHPLRHLRFRECRRLFRSPHCDAPACAPQPAVGGCDLSIRS